MCDTSASQTQMNKTTIIQGKFLNNHDIPKTEKERACFHTEDRGLIFLYSVSGCTFGRLQTPTRHTGGICVTCLNNPAKTPKKCCWGLHRLYIHTLHIISKIQIQKCQKLILCNLYAADNSPKGRWLQHILMIRWVWSLLWWLQRLWLSGAQWDLLTNTLYYNKS